jgi:putative sigma-54 modulation protein
MNVEYTGRHYEITSAIRKEVENGLAKIRKILGDRFEAKAILTVEKHRHKAEITITPRNGPIVGLAQARDMTIAVNEALDHLEKQAVKYKTRWQSKKRSARKSEEVKKWNGHSPQPEEAEASEKMHTNVGLT